MRNIGRIASALVLVAAACSSSKSDTNAPAKNTVPAVQLGSADIGPAGGTVTGGAVTIQIPAGALTATKTITIAKLDPSAAQLPQGTALANDLYQLGPDDVTFAQPVTVTIAIDPTKKRADGKGAVVLFRASAGTQGWTPYGANDTSATTLVGTTTHFSDWAPTTAAESACFLNICGPIPPPRIEGQPPPQPDANTNRTLGLDCQVPAVGAAAGVHCIGTGPNQASPYQCSCIASTQVLGSWDLLPPDTAVSAMAAQCGAQCPTTCDIQMVCAPAAPGQKGYQCQSGLTPTVTCSSTDGVTGTCSCGSSSMPTSGPTPPTSDALFALWQACGGSCNDIDAGDYVCPGSIEYTPDSGQGCVVETAGTCRDNHSYGFTCDTNATPNQPPTTCHCMMDGKPTKDVQSNCISAYAPCGIPKSQGQ